MPPATDFAAAFGPIERAHRGFSVGALGRLYPNLQGQELARALAREMLRDTAYLENARQRLRGAVDAAHADPNLTQDEVRERVRKATEAERRYLRMHIEAAGNRMVREAEAAAIWAAGDTEAYWALGQRRTHTRDCLVMAGKTWPKAVLLEVNPANRHTGCGCRLMRVSDARAAGLPMRRGYQTAKMRALTIMREARRKPAPVALAMIQSGKRKQRPWSGFAVPKLGAGPDWDPVKHPRGARGRFRDTFRMVPGAMPKEVEPQFKRMLNAAATGDMKTYESLRQEIKTMLLVHVPTKDPRRAKLAARFRTGGRGEKQNEIANAGLATLRAVHSAIVSPPLAPERAKVGATRAVPRLGAKSPATGRRPVRGVEEEVVPVGLAPAPGALIKNPDFVRGFKGKVTQKRENQEYIVGPQTAGITDAWDSEGNYSWFLPNDATGRAVQAAVQKDNNKSQWDWHVTPDNRFVVSPSHKLDEPVRRAMAREAELRYDALRYERRSSDIERHHDPRPLDLGSGEWEHADATPGTPGASPYPGISNQAVGLLGELGAVDAMRMLKDLGLMDENDNRLYLPEAHGDSYCPIDVLMNGWGTEVKTISMREFILDNQNKSAAVTVYQAERKRQAVTDGRWSGVRVRTDKQLMDLAKAQNPSATAKQQEKAGKALIRDRDNLMKQAVKAAEGAKGANAAKAKKAWAQVAVHEKAMLNAGLADDASGSWEMQTPQVPRPQGKTTATNAADIFNGASQGQEELMTGIRSQGLKPAVMQPIVDLDNGVVHFFFKEYPDEESAFSSAPRIPVDMTRRLADGTLKPGDIGIPGGGEGAEERTIYLGVAKLRGNPLSANELPGFSAARLRDEPGGIHQRMKDAPVLAHAGPTQPVARLAPEDIKNADVRRRAEAAHAASGGKPIAKVAARTAKPTATKKRTAKPKPAAKPAARGRKATVAGESDLDKRIIELHRQGVTGKEIARRLGYAQPHISRRLGAMRKAGIDLEATKRGERRDRPRKPGQRPVKAEAKIIAAIRRMYRDDPGGNAGPQEFSFAGTRVVGIMKVRQKLKAEWPDMTNEEIDKRLAAFRKELVNQGRLTAR